MHRLEASDILCSSSGEFEAAFEKHNAIMLLIEPATGGVVDANAAAAAFYACTRNQLRSLTLEDLGISPGTGSRFVLPFSHGVWKTFATTTGLSVESLRPVELCPMPFCLDHRKLVLVILRDLTQLRDLEQQTVNISELERERIGRDLHDSLGGHLTGVSLLAAALARTLTEKGGAESAMAQEVAESVREAIAHTRRIAHGLCPLALASQGLISSLHDMAAEVSRRAGVDCYVCACDELDLPDTETASQLFRIVEEAVQNALRHAGARHIEIRLCPLREGMLLRVWNDGKELPAHPDASQGLGLKTMNYRADILGSHLEMRPARGGGTEVTCLLPPNRFNRSRAANGADTHGK